MFGDYAFGSSYFGQGPGSVLVSPDESGDPTVLFCVPDDRRLFGVRPENRTFDIAFDDRTIRVKRQRGCCDA